MVVNFEEFKKLDLRVARIKKAEDLPGADKLYLITADIGPDEQGSVGEKTFVAGIKKHYSKEELIGKDVVVITNLQPAVIRGVASGCMLLAASDKDKKRIVILTTDKPMDPGSKIS
jgi:methionyl-tRNA synthetase